MFYIVKSFVLFVLKLLPILKTAFNSYEYLYIFLIYILCFNNHTLTRLRQTCRRWTLRPGRGCPRRGSTACPWSAGPVCTPGRPPGPGCRSSGGTAAWAALSLDYQYLLLSKCFVVCLQHLGNCNWYKQVYFDAVVLNIVLCVCVVLTSSTFKLKI